MHVARYSHWSDCLLQIGVLHIGFVIKENGDVLKIVPYTAAVGAFTVILWLSLKGILYWKFVHSLGRFCEDLTANAFGAGFVRCHNTQHLISALLS